MKNIFLVLSVTLSLVAVVPYLVNIVRGKAKPNIASWTTWSLLTGLAAVAAWSAGEKAAAIYIGVATLGTALVVVLGLRHGYVKYSLFDVLCQLSALVGIILWQVFNSPALAVVAAVTIDLIGALPTVRHSWQKPHEEAWQTYAIGGIAALFAIVALQSYNWVSLPYPLYIVLADLILVVIILSRLPKRAKA